MARLILYYSTNEEKQNLISDISKFQRYKILKISKECPGKGKSPYKRTYIDLSEK